MVLEAHEIDRRMQAFFQACADAGARLTPQRIGIFREIAESVDHPDAEQIFRRVREQHPSLSLDTVYRTLWWLTELGLVTALGPSRDRTRFDANLSRHHHFICTVCGLTRDFYSEELNLLTLPQEVASIGSIERTQVEVMGICHACAAKRQAASPGGGAEASPPKGRERPSSTAGPHGAGEQ